jgi:DegV family protein with EDD domain
MVAVVTDSASNLPEGLAEELGIAVVPMYVRLGDETFRDGVDLTTAEFYERLSAAGASASTSMPSPADFLAAFEGAGSRDVVCVTVAASMSAANHQAALAAERFGGNVEIVDSLSASMAEGFVVLAAARAARTGAGRAEAAAAARRVAGAARLFAAVDTFDYLQRSGRVTKLQAYAATVLDIKPVFAFREGEASAVARPRTRRRAVDRVVAETIAAAAGGGLHLAAIHAGSSVEAEEVAERVSAEADVVERWVVEVTPVVGAHVGPGLVGAAFYSEPNSEPD